MHKTRGAALLAAAAMVASGLAACGDEGEPTQSSSTASPSAVETDSPSGSESAGSESSSSSSGSSGSGSDDKVAELPAAAKKRSKEGAIAFNKFYQEQVGQALKTGDTATIEAYSNNCIYCNGMAKRVKEHSARGVRMNKNPHSVRGLSATKRSDGGYRVKLTVDASEYHEVLTDGSKGRTAKPISITIVTDTQWANGQWEMRDQVRVK